MINIRLGGIGNHPGTEGLSEMGELTDPGRVEDGGRRAHVDDAAAASDQEVRERLGGPQGPPEVDVVQPLRGGDVNVEHGSHIANTGIVDQHVQPAAAVRHGLGGGCHGGSDPDVERQDRDIVETAECFRDLYNVPGRGEDVVAALR